jgi:hypothetical protein
VLLKANPKIYKQFAAIWWYQLRQFILDKMDNLDECQEYILLSLETISFVVQKLLIL